MDAFVYVFYVLSMEAAWNSNESDGQTFLAWVNFFGPDA